MLYASKHLIRVMINLTEQGKKSMKALLGKEGVYTSNGDVKTMDMAEKRRFLLFFQFNEALIADNLTIDQLIDKLNDSPNPSFINISIHKLAQEIKSRAKQELLTEKEIEEAIKIEFITNGYLSLGKIIKFFKSKNTINVNI